MVSDAEMIISGRAGIVRKAMNTCDDVKPLTNLSLTLSLATIENYNTNDIKEDYKFSQKMKYPSK